MGRIIIDDALNGLKQLDDCSVNMCVTSPPYYNLRDYGIAGQIGTEETPEEYIERLTEVFREVRRVLKNDGTLWVVISDSYAGSQKGRQGNGVALPENLSKRQLSNGGSHAGVLKRTMAKGCKNKDLIGIPWLFAFALRVDGWYLRSDIIWEKPNVFPESVKDRCPRSYEHIFMFAKQKNYYYNAKAIQEPVSAVSIKRGEYGWHGKGDNGEGNYAGLGAVEKLTGRMVHEEGRNKRDVWRVNTASYREAHFATFPPELIRPCILAGSREGDVVLDPFMGSGTTALVALQEKRDYVGVEIQPEYEELIKRRISSVQGG